MNESRDRRIFKRADLDVKVVAKAETETEVLGRANNVSLNGVSIQCEQPLPIDTECEITVYMTDSVGRDIEATGVVIRHDDDGKMAVRFTNVTPRNFLALREYTNPKTKDQE